MPVNLAGGFAEWRAVFSGRESEFNERLVRLGDPEKQTIRISHCEEENCLTSPIHRQAERDLDQSEMLVLDDAIFNDADASLVLPFMPEYKELEKKIGNEIREPHNSALFSYAAYGHLLQDQMSKEGLYEQNALSGGLPLAFNTHGRKELRDLVSEQWRRPCHLVGENITRFKRLHCIIHRNHQIRRRQADFMRREFGPSAFRKLLRIKPMRRRLYLTRATGRHIINDAEVFRFLKERGFERVEDSHLVGMSIAKQAAFFHSAEMIVSPQGSHLINAFFCHEEAHLVELMKFCWMEYSPVTVLRSVSGSARYGYTVDWEPWGTSEQKVRLADIQVDLAKLEAVMEKMSVPEEGKTHGFIKEEPAAE